MKLYRHFRGVHGSVNCYSSSIFVPVDEHQLGVMPNIFKTELQTWLTADFFPGDAPDGAKNIPFA